jgi:hypothetical protein
MNIRRLVVGLAVVVLLAGACTDSTTETADPTDGTAATAAPDDTRPPDTRTPEQIAWCTRLNEIPVPPSNQTVQVMDQLLDELPTEEWRDDTELLRDKLAQRAANPNLVPIEEDPEAVVALSRFWSRCVYIEDLDQEDFERQMAEAGVDIDDPSSGNGPTTTAPAP